MPITKPISELLNGIAFNKTIKNIKQKRKEDCLFLPIMIKSCIIIYTNSIAIKPNSKNMDPNPLIILELFLKNEMYSENS
ncbi:hypothetical protein, partial [uncultured Duncaniella sp.]|uniref:hypothetical protein n=1 Tax=uncultured Duncaniella sp. TaxID=2768039 RepID=UPI00265FB78D